MGGEWGEGIVRADRVVLEVPPRAWLGEDSGSTPLRVITPGMPGWLTKKLVKLRLL